MLRVSYLRTVLLHAHLFKVATSDFNMIGNAGIVTAKAAQVLIVLSFRRCLWTAQANISWEGLGCSLLAINQERLAQV